MFDIRQKKALDNFTDNDCYKYILWHRDRDVLSQETFDALRSYFRSDLEVMKDLLKLVKIRDQVFDLQKDKIDLITFNNKPHGLDENSFILVNKKLNDLLFL